jgi:phosphoenolpyruvate-protein kinase (PTS system EI component)
VAWLDIYGDGDQTEMICTPERRKDEKMKKKKEEEEEEKKKDKRVKKKKKKKAFCSSRTTNKMLDIMSAIEEAKKLGSSVGYCSLK